MKGYRTISDLEASPLGQYNLNVRVKKINLNDKVQRI
jgi:hypothetical protein